MVDNVAITAGSGTTIAADDVGGVLYQRVKATWGPDGTANDADVATGKPLPVQLRSPTGTDLTGSAGTASAAVVTVQGIASGTVVPISDGSGSLTVDAPVGTPAFVRLSDGSAAITTLPVSLSSVPSHAVTVASGGVASGGIASGAIASGAVASGAFASGSIAAGAIATGATSIAANEDDASANADTGVKILVKRSDTPAATSGTDGDYEPLQVSGGLLWVNPLSYFASPTTDITRPADTTAYATNDTFSNSTSAPTSGGFTLTSAARKSGGSGVLTDMIITSSNAGALQGEIHLFNQAATNVNDNAAWALSDADAKNRIAIIPFTLVTDANNSYYHAQNLNIGFTTVGSANLRYLVKVKAAYTPISAEVLTVTAKCIGVD